MIAVTQDPLVSPVNSQAVQDWLRLDEPDPIISGLLLAATQATIDWIQRDLLQRAWTVTYHDWPKPAQSRQLVYGWPNYSDGVELPYAQLVSVDSVTVYGEALDAADYYIVAGLPAKVRFNGFINQGEQELPAIVVNYQAGFDVVPSAILTAITMIAAYMYEHRGGCTAEEAMKMSGASTILHPYRARAGVAL